MFEKRSARIYRGGKIPPGSFFLNAKAAIEQAMYSVQS